jgi:hypothetical protein
MMKFCVPWTTHDSVSARLKVVRSRLVVAWTGEWTKSEDVSYDRIALWREKNA